MHRNLELPGSLVYQLFQLIVLPLQYLLQLVQFKVSIDTSLHLFHLERLINVVRTAAMKGFDLVFGGVERAEEDHGDGRKLWVGFQPLAHLVAIHLRHIDIQ